jgi:hypothetical protein
VTLLDKKKAPRWGGSKKKDPEKCLQNSHLFSIIHHPTPNGHGSSPWPWTSSSRWRKRLNNSS